MSSHQPVLLEEVLSAFDQRHLCIFVDGTLGAGGHSKAILRAHPEIEKFIGIDQDPDARALAAKNLTGFDTRIEIIASNFCELEATEVNGILLDLGVSSMQLDRPERGFSFTKEGPLDMRMDPTTPRSAADIVNQVSHQELCCLLQEYGELPRARRVAAAIIAARPLYTTTDLVRVTAPHLLRKGRSHPATCLFQALRIAVNDELGALQRGLERAMAALAPGGRLAVITFHSLEDRIVKQAMQAASRGWTSDPLNPYCGRKSCERQVRLTPSKAIGPTQREIRANPRSRSAKLRICEKLCY